MFLNDDNHRILSHYHRSSQQFIVNRNTFTGHKRRQGKTLIVSSEVLLDRSRAYNPTKGGDGTDHDPIYQYLLRRNSGRDDGYLRRLDAKAAGEDPKRTAKVASKGREREREVVLRVRSELLGVIDDFKKHKVSELEVSKQERDDDIIHQ